MSKKDQKTDRREYTLKIIPHQGETIRSIRLPLKKIKLAAAALFVGALLFIGAFGYATYSISLVQKDQAELDDLRQVNTIQQTQILQLAKKANALQDDIDKLNELEGEIRQIAGIESVSSENALEEKHDGQGGPGIAPNIQNLDEALNGLDRSVKEKKRSLEALKSAMYDRQKKNHFQQAKINMTPSIWPTSGDVSSPYGLRWNGSDFHPGIDIANDAGTPVVATADGTVIESGWNSGGYGYMVDIDHGNGVVTRYAHNSQLAVSAGTRVQKGQVIAYMGSTGFSTGPHVHYEVLVNGKAVNPSSFL